MVPNKKKPVSNRETLLLVEAHLPNTVKSIVTRTHNSTKKLTPTNTY